MYYNKFTLKLEKDDNGTFLVTSDDYPELATFGEDVDDALARGRDALEEAIAARIADRQDVPLPAGRGQHTVSLPHQTFIKMILWTKMKKEKVKKAEMARRLNTHAPQIDRLVDVTYSSKPEQIDAAFAALGLHIHGVSFG